MKLVFTLISAAAALLACTDSAKEPIDGFQYTRIFSDSEGVSHFASETVRFHVLDPSPYTPPMVASEVTASTGFFFVSVDPGGHTDWYNATRKQFVVTLRGEVEIEVSDGEVRRFGPGSVLLAEDIDGRGHKTRVLSAGPAFGIALPVAVQAAD